MKVIQFTPPDSKEDAVLIEEDVVPHFYNVLHRHREIQISLIVKGEGILTAGNYSQAFKPGEVYIIGTNQPHFFKSDPAYFNGEEKKEAHAIHIYFDFKRIPEAFFLLQELTAVRKFINSCTISLQLPHEYEAQAAALIRKVNGQKNLERLLGLFDIFHFFSSSVTGWKSLSTGFDKYAFYKLEGNRMNDVFRYTLDNYAQTITLQTIASIAHITPHAFCKYFKQHTRKTYNHFLNEVRVNEACKKIISGEYDSFSYIAYTTGFKGASNFNRVFKKTTGMSPSDYKKEFRRKTA